MRQKIFRKSDESRVRFDFDFEPVDWDLRSTGNKHRNSSGYVDSYGNVYYIHRVGSFAYILPACSI